MYQMYLENNVKIDETIAALLWSAITSDTLMFRSPNCTAVSEKAGRELAEIAHIDIEELAGNMFKAGSNLVNKTAKEIYFKISKNLK